MNYCSECGNPVVKKRPAGDNRDRFVCLGCNTIHYSNPNIITGALVADGNRVLLCRRAISPRVRMWTLPAGFMENNETAAEGAARETLEEALATVSIDGIYTLYDVPRFSQLYIFHRAHLVEDGYGAGPETLEVRFFYESELPWGELAFPIVKDTLENYFKDYASRIFPVRSQTCYEVIDGE
jgi:ADP-ribose pyrophosphatase YjhB (NUDIX family)